MPKRIVIKLSDEQRKQLERWSKQPPKPYLRVRARAILAIATGKPIYQVATELRIKVRRAAVAEWVKRFQEKGPEGLLIRDGRGRKSCFFPSGPRDSSPGDRPETQSPPE